MLRALMRSTRHRFVPIAAVAVAAVGLAVPASAALLNEGDREARRAAQLLGPLADEVCEESVQSTAVPAHLLPASLEISVCDLRGAVIRSESLSVHVPTRTGRGAASSSILGEDAPMDTVTTLSVVNTGTNIKVEIERAGDEARNSRAQTDQPDSASARDDPCSTKAYRYIDARTDAMDWHFNPDSAPQYLAGRTAELAIIDGADVIATGANDCGLRPLTEIRENYLGTTSKRADCDGPDGQSTVDFGPRPEDTLGTSCWWYSTIDGVNRIFEADIRLQNDPGTFYYFEPGDCEDQYELAGVAAHEFGHAFGLAHVSEKDYPHQTMSASAPTCSYEQSSLGRGDWLGLRNLYSG